VVVVVVVNNDDNGVGGVCLKGWVLAMAVLANTAAIFKSQNGEGA
jgi:hypothetical protein